MIIFYKMQKKKFYQLYSSVSASKNIFERLKRYILIKMSFRRGFICMGIVCFNYFLIYINLDLFEESEKNITKPYVQEDFSNVKLICPMVKPENQWSQMNDSVFASLRNFKPLAFKKPPIAEDLDCSYIFNENQENQEHIKSWSSKRLVYLDDDMLETDCESIKRRNYFPDFPNSKEEAEFPIAFNRLVYKDYLFLEMELATEYAPQNYYCYIVDSKSSLLFKKRIKDLASCFPNVYVSENEYNTTSRGNYVNVAYYDCLKILVEYTWNYVVILNNHDVILKTNYELVQIYKWFCGANDVQLTPPDLKRVNLTFDWTYFGLGIFKNMSKNYAQRFNFDYSKTTIKFAQGHAQNSLSRSMVNFMINELDLTKFLYQLEGLFGVDELFVATINADDYLKVPGGFTYECINKKIATNDVTRHTFWIEDPRPNSICLSNKWRHEICVLGIEDIARLRSRPEIFINKIMPEVDFAAAVCWYEHMFNHSHLQPPTSQRLNKSHYFSLPHVKYHYKRMINKTVSQKDVDCTLNGTLAINDLNRRKDVPQQISSFLVKTIFYIAYVVFCIYACCGLRANCLCGKNRYR